MQRIIWIHLFVLMARVSNEQYMSLSLALLGSVHSIDRLQFAKKLSAISGCSQFQKPALLIYCLYCTVHKRDYQEALLSLKNAETLDEMSWIDYSVTILLKAAVLTRLGEHKTAYLLAKEGYLKLKMPQKNSNPRRPIYLKCLPIIIDLFDILSFRKDFHHLFQSAYEDMKAVSTNKQIMKTLQQKAQLIGSKLTCTSSRPNLKPRSASNGSRFHTSSQSGFNKQDYVSKLYEVRKREVQKGHTKSKQNYEGDPYQLYEKQKTECGVM